MIWSELPWRRLALHGLLGIALNSAIAVALTVFGENGLVENMIYSQWIGLSIWALIDVGRHFIHPRGELTMMQAIVLTLVGVLIGYFVGSAMGDLTHGRPALAGWKYIPNRMVGFLFMSLVTGAVMVYFFMSREMLLKARTERERAERQAAQAQLSLLQSQLDPHMLFNTLANLRALIGSDATRATDMLDKLVDFLRATLSASRSNEHSLQLEFARLSDYLSLMQIRMGKRLDFDLQLPCELAQAQVPSLILQSLVENAVLHGLEPKVEGGKVTVSAARDGADLQLQVQDNGLGCDPSDLREGFGLAQVRERLASRYGARATIDFIALRADPICLKASNGIENRGCTVRLRLPVSSVPS